MGAACPCMKAKEKEVVNSRGITNTRGGVVLGGGEDGGSRSDIAAARSAKFEENRKK